MHEKRDCSVLASMLRQDTIHVVDAIVIGITDVNSSAFQLCELNSTFPGVDPQAPSTHAVWGMQHLADVRARKVLQFQHFMAVMARVVNSPHACGRTDSVLAFLDDDVLPCPDATMWLEVIARWLQAFPRIVAAVRAAAGSSGVLLTCEVASRMHAALSRATLDRITAIDVMMDEHLQAWEPGHYLYFHHNLFRHRDDHASLIQERRWWETGVLLHECYAPVMWGDNVRLDNECRARLYTPCTGLLGMPEIPHVHIEKAHGTLCSEFESVHREWTFVLGSVGHSCTQACDALQARYVCDVHGLDVANSKATVQRVAPCSGQITYSHKLTAPNMEASQCYARGTGCQVGTTGDFCAEQESTVQRVCPCSRARENSGARR